MKQNFYSTQLPYNCGGFEVVGEKVTNVQQLVIFAYIPEFCFFFALLKFNKIAHTSYDGVNNTYNITSTLKTTYTLKLVGPVPVQYFTSCGIVFSGSLQTS